MTYFSTVRINPLRAASRKLLTSPRAMHGAVIGGLADYSAAERTLWRVDTSNPRRPTLLVVTESKPDWTHVVEQAGWPDADGAHCDVYDYEPVLNSLKPGQNFAFLVTTNPVHSVLRQRANTERRTTRTGLRTADAQLAWFAQRAGGWGFELAADSLRVSASERLSFAKNGRGPKVTLTTATFEGSLRVTDPDALAQALRSGLGPAKAYGCGLLTLSPATA
ncbi:type I-E CRISPR-associated protein Cas6/Cse3/CasE [Streptomyces sp. NPDC000941]